MQNQKSNAVDGENPPLKKRRIIDGKTALRMGLAWLVFALLFTVSTVGSFANPHPVSGIPWMSSRFLNVFVTAMLWFLSLFWLRLAYKLRG